MSRVKVKTPRKYYVRVNGEAVEQFDTLGLARKYVHTTYSKVLPNQTLPQSVEIIKQVVLEEVMDVFEPKPMQILMATDLDSELYK